MTARGHARAADIARDLGVSERTIYRDLSLLAAQGVAVAGAPGVGYILRPAQQRQQFSLSEDEVEAFSLGMQIVAAWADEGLGRASASLLVKMRDFLPDAIGRSLSSVRIAAPASDRHVVPPRELPMLRLAVRNRSKVSFEYRDRMGRATFRNVRPLSLAFFGPVWILAAWCELRDDFRSFRIDRVSKLAVSRERFVDEPGKSLADLYNR